MYKLRRLSITTASLGLIKSRPHGLDESVDRFQLDYVFPSSGQDTRQYIKSIHGPSTNDDCSTSSTAAQRQAITMQQRTFITVAALFLLRGVSILNEWVFFWRKPRVVATHELYDKWPAGHQQASSVARVIADQ